MRRIWEPCSFVGQKGVCTVCIPTFYIFMYPHIQIAVSVDADGIVDIFTVCMVAMLSADAKKKSFPAPSSAINTSVYF